MNSIVPMARFIADVLGKHDPVAATDNGVGTLLKTPEHTKTFTDDFVEITISTRSPAMVIERRASNNPVVMVDDTGKIVRYHGEGVRVNRYLQKMLKKLVAELPDR